MKKYSFFFFLTFIWILSISVVQAQETDTIPQDNSIKGQFDKILEKSNSYQNYKVVPKEKLLRLKSNVMDSLAKQQKKLAEKNQIIATNTKEKSKLQQQISDLETELATVQEQKESMDVLGISIKKNVYSLLLWVFIAILVALLAWYVIRFSKSNIVTKKSVKDLAELQKEYDEHRKTALEREQKVRRQLQDEINKSRGV